jgi:callose synthase
MIQVQASIAALRTVGELRRPTGVRWTLDMDLLDWLGAWFGFQV